MVNASSSVASPIASCCMWSMVTSSCDWCSYVYLLVLVLPYCSEPESVRHPWLLRETTTGLLMQTVAWSSCSLEIGPADPHHVSSYFTENQWSLLTITLLTMVTITRLWNVVGYLIPIFGISASKHQLPSGGSHATTAPRYPWVPALQLCLAACHRCAWSCRRWIGKTWPGKHEGFRPWNNEANAERISCSHEWPWLIWPRISCSKLIHNPRHQLILDQKLQIWNQTFSRSVKTVKSSQSAYILP